MSIEPKEVVVDYRGFAEAAIFMAFAGVNPFWTREYLGRVVYRQCTHCHAVIALVD